MCEQPEDPEADQTYVHCTLQRGNQYKMSWLPIRFAKVARVLKLRKVDGTWENGWIVVATYGVTTGDRLVAIDRVVRRQEKARRPWNQSHTARCGRTS